MEVRNVVVYKEIETPIPTKERFYKLSESRQEEIDITTFLNAIDETEDALCIKTISKSVERFCPVIATFYEPKNNVNYLVFTSEEYDREQKLMLYALKYNEDLPNPMLGFISSEFELILVYKILDSLFLNR